MNNKELEVTVLNEISTLGSAILNYVEDKIYVTGFNDKERLQDYLDNNINCIGMRGIFPYIDVDFSSVPENTLFILQKEGIEFKRYEFVLLKKDTVVFKGEDKKNKTKVYSIRKCNFTNQYSYKDLEYSKMFDNLRDLEKYFVDRYSQELIL